MLLAETTLTCMFAALALIRLSLADAPIGPVDWCQIYHAQMITALGSEPTRNFWLPAEIMNYSREVIQPSLQRSLSWCNNNLVRTHITFAGVKMLDICVQRMMHGTITSSMSCGCQR